MSEQALRRMGTIRVSGDLIHDHDNPDRALLNRRNLRQVFDHLGFLPLDVYTCMSSQTLIYTGWCESFDAVSVGEVFPEYIVSTTWEQSIVQREVNFAGDPVRETRGSPMLTSVNLERTNLPSDIRQPSTGRPSVERDGVRLGTGRVFDLDTTTMTDRVVPEEDDLPF